MKIIVLVALVVVAVSEVTGRRSCLSRREKKLLDPIKNVTRCYAPHPSLVQLPVPDDYDFLQPSVVQLSKCTGLACGFGWKCLPKRGSVTMRKFKVYAKNKDGSDPVCVKVSVEEHHACECRCDTLYCPDNQEFNKDICECECNRRLSKACMLRRERDGEPVMWSEESCSCVCNYFEECDSSSVWDRNICKCVDI